MENYIVYGISLVYGILIGSFLNVCIYRIPKEQSVVTEPSHCMSCGKRLKWYELLPLISYMLQYGRCRKCKASISIQYPIIEALNGLIYVLVFYAHGWDTIYILILNIIYCFAISALIVLSVIDFRTKIIPPAINVFLLLMGLLTLMIRYLESGKRTDVIWEHVIGFFAISIFLLFIFHGTRGKAIGGGDVKLMASAGLLLGWQLVILAFFLGCILASIIHTLRMRIWNAGRSLAFGPYLSLGIIIALFFGRQMITWYIDTFFP
jgi:leader peptidase (prepilin peptidase)/N-methyltransferase